MTYPFNPEMLDAMPEVLAELFRTLDIKLLEEICSRLNHAGQLNQVTIEDIRALRAQGIDLNEIGYAIQNATNIAKDELNQLFDDAVARNQAFYTELIDKASLTAPQRLVADTDIEAIRQQTQGDLTNLTQSAGFLLQQGGSKVLTPPAKAYQWALDNAAKQVQSGAISYNEAIRNAVKSLADSGIKMVDYESGRTDHADVAARRAVMTGISQLCAKYTEQAAEFLETNRYEVSAHRGARDVGEGPANHKGWQGKVYSTDPYDELYPDIYEVCGLATGEGLEGWNCRHRRWCWVEGVSERTYTDEELENIDPPPFEFEGKAYTMYEATQKQRDIERTIRKLEREKAAYKAAGLDEDAQAVDIRIQRLKKKYTEFSSTGNLPTQPERMRAYGPTDEDTSRAEILKAKRIKEAPIRAAIRNGEYSRTLNPEKQARHMVSTSLPGRSVITLSTEELQEIIDREGGNGALRFDQNDAWDKSEVVDVGREIGYTINGEGAIKTAYSIKIHYSKTGVHAVPFTGRRKK